MDYASTRTYSKEPFRRRCGNACRRIVSRHVHASRFGSSRGRSSLPVIPSLRTTTTFSLMGWVAYRHPFRVPRVFFSQCRQMLLSSTRVFLFVSSCARLAFVSCVFFVRIVRFFVVHVTLSSNSLQMFLSLWCPVFVGSAKPRPKPRRNVHSLRYCKHVGLYVLTPTTYNVPPMTPHDQPISPALVRLTLTSWGYVLLCWLGYNSPALYRGFLSLLERFAQ